MLKTCGDIQFISLSAPQSKSWMGATISSVCWGHIRRLLKQPMFAEIKRKMHEVFIFSMSDAKAPLYGCTQLE